MRPSLLLIWVFLSFSGLAIAQADPSKLDEQLQIRLSSAEAKSPGGQIKILQESELEYEVVLKAAYERTLSVINEPETKKEFEQAHKGWLQYREIHLHALRAAIKKLSSVETGLEFRAAIDVVHHRIDEINFFYYSICMLQPFPGRVGFNPLPGT